VLIVAAVAILEPLTAAKAAQAPTQSTQKLMSGCIQVSAYVTVKAKLTHEDKKGNYGKLIAREGGIRNGFQHFQSSVPTTQITGSEKADQSHDYADMHTAKKQKNEYNNS
jgi:hypothetical protein